MASRTALPTPFVSVPRIHRPSRTLGPRTAFVADTVVLDGTDSSDVDGDALTYEWSLRSRPVLSGARLDDPTAPTPSFIVDFSGTYVVDLVVSDGRSQSEPDSIVVSTSNSRPVADAGSNQTVDVGATVFLDGRGSRDADGDRLTFKWSLISLPTGSSTRIVDAAIAAPTFVVDAEGFYVLQLVVNDGETNSLPDTVVIAAVGETPLPPITLGDFNVGEDLQVSATIVLGVAAPAGLEVTVTSSDPSRVLLSADPKRGGAGTVSVPVFGGRMTVPRFYVQSLHNSGQVLLTISAPGYAIDTSKVNLFPSGFVIWSPSFTTTARSSNKVVQLRSVLLNNLTLQSVGFGQAIRGGVSVNVDVTSLNASVGKITTSRTRFSAGELFSNVHFDPLSPGVTEISIATPEGFDLPAGLVRIKATVIP